MEMEGFEFSVFYELLLLKEGQRQQLSGGGFKVGGVCTLLRGPHLILIGTGSCHEKDDLIRALASHDVKPESIEYVICTHAHPETVGNLNLFPHATHIIGWNVVKEGCYVMHDFSESIPFEIDEHVQVIPSPGISHSAVSVVVSNTNLGIVAMADAVFQCEEDMEDPDIWTEASADPEAHQQSRITLLQDVQHIVPRYGPSFCVPDSYKTNMKIVMTP